MRWLSCFAHEVYFAILTVMLVSITVSAVVCGDFFRIFAGAWVIGYSVVFSAFTRSAPPLAFAVGMIVALRLTKEAVVGVGIAWASWALLTCVERLCARESSASNSITRSWNTARRTFEAVFAIAPALIVIVAAWV